jgi:integrase/recombinase XerD
MKLSEAFVIFADESGALTTTQSRDAYHKTVNQLATHCGDKALGSYSTDELTAFCLRPGAPATIRGRRDRIRSIFRWCAYRKLVARDPTADLKYTVNPRGGAVKQHTWLTKPETAQVASGFNLEDPRSHRDYVVYRTTLMLGLRRSETASLRWPMFRDDLSTVSLIGKGRKLATLTVPPKLRETLAAWRQLEPEGAVPFPRFNWNHDFKGNWRMTPWWTTPIGVDAVYQIIRKHTPVAPHDLRRSFAGILEADGVPLKDVQGLMRHSNLATTDRYLQTSPARLRSVVDGFDWG